MIDAEPNAKGGLAFTETLTDLLETLTRDHAASNANCINNVNASCVTLQCVMHSMKMELHQRLAWARKTAGFETATSAAIALGETVSTYIGHENGQRGFGRRKAEKYARRFNVSLEWLLTGRGDPRPRPSQHPHERKMAALVGYVAAGAEAHFVSDGELGTVEAPENVGDGVVAVEVRGDSLGSFFDRWLIFYQDVRRPVTSDLIGQLCVVGTAEGRVVIKKIVRSRTKGRFHLLSQNDQPILDAEVEWAAKVMAITPRQFAV